MKKVYISSTVEDLKEYRLALADALRRCGFNVDNMENHSARDERPKSACERDASNCDIYLGIFAWRYGYIPDADNPEAKSITELEYLAAGRAGKPRLIFLLADDAPWPSSLRDAEREQDEGRRIRDFRNRLRGETWAAFFKSPDDLAKEALTSILQLESTRPVTDTTVVDSLKAAAELGASYLPNLQQQIDQLGASEFVAVRLTTPWWNTRLHLAAALASDFTEIRGFVLLDERSRFLTMASPVEIRRALTKAVPKLEIAYLQAREAARTAPWPEAEVDRILASYAAGIAAVLGGPEVNKKQIITPVSLRELGIKPEGQALEQFGIGPRPLSADLLRRRSPYVVLIRDGNLEGIIDCAELASRMASTIFQ